MSRRKGQHTERPKGTIPNSDLIGNGMGVIADQERAEDSTKEIERTKEAIRQDVKEFGDYLKALYGIDSNDLENQLFGDRLKALLNGHWDDYTALSTDQKGFPGNEEFLEMLSEHFAELRKVLKHRVAALIKDGGETLEQTFEHAMGPMYKDLRLDTLEGKEKEEKTLIQQIDEVKSQMEQGYEIHIVLNPKISREAEMHAMQVLQDVLSLMSTREKNKIRHAPIQANDTFKIKPGVPPVFTFNPEASIEEIKGSLLKMIKGSEKKKK